MNLLDGRFECFLTSQNNASLPPRWSANVTSLYFLVYTSKDFRSFHEVSPKVVKQEAK